MKRKDWATIERQTTQAGTVWENTMLMRQDLREAFSLKELQDLSYTDLCKLWCDFKNEPSR